jgi:HlyD family secretion protein
MNKTPFFEGILQKIASGNSFLGSGPFSKKVEHRLRRFLDSFKIALRPDANAMVLRQSYAWSRGMLWTIIFVILAVLIWACIAEMDEVIHAVGKLQPRGSAQEVQAPVGGVITENLVREGQAVKAGDLLVRLDPKVATAEVKSLQDQLAALKNEEAFYNQLFQRDGSLVAPVTLPAGILDLAKNHASLVAEDRLLRAVIDASSAGANLNLDQKNLFTEEQKDRLEKYENIKGQLEQATLLEINNKKILEAYTKLLESGAGSKVDFLAREAAWIESVAKVKTLQIELENSLTTFRKDAMMRLNENTKRIAEIEANFTRARLAVSQQISETTGRLEAASENLKYHEISSPASGVVFQIVAGKPGTVLGPKDTILKIVPSEELIAKVDITNRDIGFIKTGLPCEVEVDTFPKREFGFVAGELYYVSSDVLPPTDVKDFYSFPAKISLEKQHLSVRGKDVALQSGMSVNANIKIRKRRVIMLFLDNILGPIDKMKEVR